MGRNMQQKESPKLFDLCLRNMAVNIARHGKNFFLNKISLDTYTENCSKEQTETFFIYKDIQCLHSVRILEEIKNIYNSNDGDYYKDSFRKAAIFFIKGKFSYDENSELAVRYSAYFLFNEHTTEISLQLPRLDYIAKNYIDMLSLCKYLKSLTLQSCRFSEEWLCMKLPRWISLHTLDLLFSSCDDCLISQALTCCPQLEILKATGHSITNECQFYLCRQTRNSSHPSRFFQPCLLNGMCCRSGKKLKKLILCRTKITGQGVACALQHLPLLTCFVDGGLTKTDKNNHFLVEGIRALRMALLSNGQDPPSLNLEVLIDNDVSLSERNCCPHCNTVAMCKRDQPWYLFKNIAEDRASVLGISNPYDTEIYLDHIVTIFSLKRVESFFFEGPRFWIFDPQNIGVNELPPAWVSDLKEIHLCDVFCMNVSVLPYFTELLRLAVNVKSLTVSRTIAENAFVTAMAENSFLKLENISIHDADLSKISLKNLIFTDSNLKKVSLLRCRGVETFSKEHKNLALVRNCQLDIENDKASSFSLIKTHLMQISE